MEGTTLTRPSAGEMDQARMRQVAYQYLCHLEEAKVWMEKVLRLKLPCLEELEDHLRNGVLLARIGHFVTPEVVPLGSIYDPDQKRYKAAGLSFRHTDNISLWLRALSRSGFPRIFLPEVTDVYDMKNMPKVIYCIHALSAHLFRLGKAPAIQDVYGKAEFSEDVISNACQDLKNIGMALPAFQKIGGMFADENLKTTNNLQQAIQNVNEAVEQESAKNLLLSMTDPSLKLINVMRDNIDKYLAAFHAAKKEKCEVSLNKSLSESYEADSYDDLLTQAEIQGYVRVVNINTLWEKLCSCIQAEDKSGTKNLLLEYASEIGEVFRPGNIDYYVKAMEVRSIEDSNSDFRRDLIVEGIESGNAEANHDQHVTQVLQAIVGVLKSGHVPRLLPLLQESCLNLTSINPSAAHLYFFELHEHLEMTGKLALSDVKSCILAMNCVASVSKAVDSRNIEFTWQALLQLDALLKGVIDIAESPDPALKQLYFDYLEENRTSKLNLDNSYLTLDDIQSCIEEANAVQNEQYKQLGLVQTIHSAVETKDFESLKSALNHIIISDEVNESDVHLWMSLLEEVLHEKQSDNQDIWLSDIEETAALVSKYNELAKLKLEELVEVDTALSRDDAIMLRNVIGQESLDYSVKPDVLLNELKRGRVKTQWVSESFGNIPIYFNIDSRTYLWYPTVPLSDISPAVSLNAIKTIVSNITAEETVIQERATRAATVIQSHVRGYLVRRRLRVRINAAKILQRWWRAKRIHMHKANGERALDYYLNHMKEIKSMRECWQRRQEKQQAEEIVAPVAASTDSEHLFDATEELIQKLRSEVVEAIKRNQDLSRKVEEKDTRIGLLVRNRISVAALVAERKNQRVAPKVEARGIKTLSKDSKTLLDGYQKLFYLLQTRPEYLTRIITTSSSNLNTQSFIFSLFNHGSSSRDSYLLLRLFACALKKEVEVKFQNASDAVKGNPFVLKLAVGYARQTGGQHPLKYLLAPLIHKVLEERDVLDTNPVEIYRRWINESEAVSGHQSGLPRSVAQDQALQEPEVVRRLNRNILVLKSWVSEFLNRLAGHIDRFPYALKFIAKVLYGALLQKFPQMAEKDVLKVVGHLIYYQYVNSALVAPDAFQIISLPADRPLRAEQRKNLASIAKILQFSSSKTGFGEESKHLMQLNPFIIECHEIMKKICKECCSVEALEEHYHVSQYSEAMLIQRPRVYMTVAELCDAHRLLLDRQSTVAPDAADPLHEVLHDLGAVSSPACLLGCPPEIACNLQIDKTLICLELDNQFMNDLECEKNDDVRQDESEIKMRRDAQTKELRDLQLTLARLLEKTRHFEDQLAYYEKYLGTCLSNLTTHKKSNKSQRSVKYTAPQLMEKGILVSLNSVPNNQHKNLLFEISSTNVNGVFRVKCRFMGVEIDQTDIDIQNLLSLQFEGCGVMNLFGAEINVNLLLFLLNKKFVSHNARLVSLKQQKKK